jgi:hypothetical protein
MVQLTSSNDTRQGSASPSRLATNQRQVFKFHEDDFPFVGEGCVKWAGPDYLQFQAARLALIDVTSMKMSYPTPRPTPGTSVFYTFSPDFRWVVYEKDEAGKSGLHLGRIVLPEKDRRP